MAATTVVSVARGGREYARVAVRGCLDLAVLDQLRDQLNHLLDDGARYLTLDLSLVTVCTATIADVLTRADNRAGAQHGWLALTGVKHLMHLMHVTAR